MSRPQLELQIVWSAVDPGVSHFRSTVGFQVKSSLFSSPQLSCSWTCWPRSVLFKVDLNQLGFLGPLWPSCSSWFHESWLFIALRTIDLSVIQWSLISKVLYLLAGLTSSRSVQVESMFSICGLILNAKQLSLAPSRGSVVSFIHNNYSKFFPICWAEANAVAADQHHQLADQ